jgi:hypothetical protein
VSRVGTGVTIWHHFGTPDVIGGGRIPFTISERNWGRTIDEFDPIWGSIWLPGVARGVPGEAGGGGKNWRIKMKIICVYKWKLYAYKNENYMRIKIKIIRV